MIGSRNVFLFEFRIIVLAELNFDIISADVVYPPGESYPYLLVFAPINDFFDVSNVEHLGQT